MPLLVLPPRSSLCASFLPPSLPFPFIITLARSFALVYLCVLLPPCMSLTYITLPFLAIRNPGLAAAPLPPPRFSARLLFPLLSLPLLAPYPSLPLVPFLYALGFLTHSLLFAAVASFSSCCYCCCCRVVAIDRAPSAFGDYCPLPCSVCLDLSLVGCCFFLTPPASAPCGLGHFCRSPVPCVPFWPLWHRMFLTCREAGRLSNGLARWGPAALFYGATLKPFR